MKKTSFLALAGLFVVGLGVLLFPSSGRAEGLSSPVHILAFGDSLTAGTGLKEGEDFASRLRARLQEAGKNGIVYNAGVSGETSVEGLARIEPTLDAFPETDLVLLELGANDMLQGLPTNAVTRNLAGIIAVCNSRNVKVVLAGMRAHAGLGAAYQTEFEKMYTDLSEAYRLPLYPFFLEGVTEDPALHQGDGLHPSAQGVEKIVDGILPVLLKALDDRKEAP